MQVTPSMPVPMKPQAHADIWAPGSCLVHERGKRGASQQSFVFLDISICWSRHRKLNILAAQCCFGLFLARLFPKKAIWQMWHTNRASQLICSASILTLPPRTSHEQHTCLSQPGSSTTISLLAEPPERLPWHRELAQVDLNTKAPSAFMQRTPH